jgi:hypothetical protein
MTTKLGSLLSTLRIELVGLVALFSGSDSVLSYREISRERERQDILIVALTSCFRFIWVETHLINLIIILKEELCSSSSSSWNPSSILAHSL